MNKTRLKAIEKKVKPQPKIKPLFTFDRPKTKDSLYFPREDESDQRTKAEWEKEREGSGYFFIYMDEGFRYI